MWTSDCFMTENHLDINIFQILSLLLQYSCLKLYPVTFPFIFISILLHIMSGFVAWSKMWEKPLLSHAVMCKCSWIVTSERQWGKEDWTVQTNQLHRRMKLLLYYLFVCQFLHWGSLQCTKHILPKHVSKCRVQLNTQWSLYGELFAFKHELMHARSQLLFLCTVC